MKKIALSSLLIGCCLVNAANAGTVTEACYATSHCGARGSIVWNLGGEVIGATAGGLVGNSIFGPFGAGAGLIAGGYAGWKLGGKLGADYTANEYIYFDDGTCLECDTHQIGEDWECPNGSVVTNGGVAYRCKATFTGDYWEKYTIPVCTDSPVKPSNYKDFSKYDVILRDNITNQGKEVKSGVVVFSGAVCLYVKGEKNPEPVPPTPSNKCEDLYKGNAEAIACCNYKYSDWKNGKCVCQNSRAEWKYNSTKKTGFCKVSGEPDPVDPVPGQTQQCLYTFSGDMQCANGARVSKNTSFYLNVDANKPCDAFRKEFASDQLFMLYLLDKYCSTQVNPVTPPVQGNNQAFKDAVSSLQSFFQSAKNDASVWKNADGKFNTARLASDLTAGVVLGTVGGVVSGVVIKKKQVEKGFDVLQCTVGGQKIADWGDEFEVGLRR